MKIIFDSTLKEKFPDFSASLKIVRYLNCENISSELKDFINDSAESVSSKAYPMGGRGQGLAHIRPAKGPDKDGIRRQGSVHVPRRRARVLV